MSMEPPTPPPPPPPPPPGEAFPDRSPAAFTVGDAVSYGWSVYWKNVGPLLLIAVVVFAIQLVFSVIGNVFDSVAGQIVFGVLGALLSLLITLGWMRVAVEITRGVRPEIGDVFKARGYGAFILASILFYIGALIGFLLLIVPGIIFVVVFGFYGFVIAERGDDVGCHGVAAAIRRHHARAPLGALRARGRALPHQHRRPARLRDRPRLHVGHHAARVGVRVSHVERRDGGARRLGVALHRPGQRRLNGGYASVRNSTYAFTRVLHRMTPITNSRRLSGHPPVMITAKNAMIHTNATAM